MSCTNGLMYLLTLLLDDDKRQDHERTVLGCDNVSNFMKELSCLTFRGQEAAGKQSQGLSIF